MWERIRSFPSIPAKMLNLIFLAFFIKLNGVRTACTSHILESWNFIVHSERFFCS